MPRAGFKPTIPATKRPQTSAFDRAAAEVGKFFSSFSYFFILFFNDQIPFRLLI
jgi:hypothetical protein